MKKESDGLEEVIRNNVGENERDAVYEFDDIKKLASAIRTWLAGCLPKEPSEDMGMLQKYGWFVCMKAIKSSLGVEV